MKRFINKKAVALGLAAGLALGVTGVAVAYWSSTGSGVGTATTGTPDNDLSIAQTSINSGMAPAIAADTISGTVTNNSTSQAAYVDTVTVSISSVDKASGAPAGTCDASDYTLSGATMNVQQDLAPLGQASFSGATIGFNNKASNQDACQGATVNLSFASN
jgi:hypothetical protein